MCLPRRLAVLPLLIVWFALAPATVTGEESPFPAGLAPWIATGTTRFLATGSGQLGASLADLEATWSGPGQSLALDQACPAGERRVRLALLESMETVVWGEDWNRRLFDGASARSRGAFVSTNASGELVLSNLQETPVFTVETRTRVAQNGIDLRVAFTAKSNLAKALRSCVELTPSWEWARGASLRIWRPDGRIEDFTLRSEAAEGYLDIVSGPVVGLAVSRLDRGQRRGFELRFQGVVQFQQTGKRFRWFLLPPGRDPEKPLAAGERFELRAVFTGTRSGKLELEERRATLAAEPGDGWRIPPEVFGCHLMPCAFPQAEKNRSAPRYLTEDPEQRRLMAESGITFFRVYLANFFDVGRNAGTTNLEDPISPAEGVPPRYGMADAFLETLIRELGIGVMPMVGLYCPPWLSTQRPSKVYSGLWMIHRAPPKDNEKWGALIAGLVRHWNIEKGFRIPFWQLGNEPDNPDRYWVQGTLPEFAAYWKAGAKAMRAADPSIKVSGPDLADLFAKAFPDRKAPWMEGFLDACGAEIDDFSFNLYGNEDFTKHLAGLRAALASRGLRKTVYVAEYQLSSSVTGEPLMDSFRGAVYAARALHSLMENRVDRASIYDWMDAIGIIAPSGKPRPAYHAFRMHAALGRFKNAAWLPVTASDPKLTASACRHADGRGFSLLATTDEPLVDSVELSVELPGLGAGTWERTAWTLLPDRALGEPTIEKTTLADGKIRLKQPGQGLTLWVWRRM